MHDLIIYGIPEETKPKELRPLLRQRFREQPFIQALVAHIRNSTELRFGEAAAWLHEHCEDVPLPYRWEVKASTHILYDWLAFFYEEITWNVPGRRSQVIYWSP